MDTYVFDAHWAFCRFFKETADNMSQLDFDIDEILAGYVDYLMFPEHKDDSIPRLPGPDGEVLTRAVLKLYDDLNIVTFSIHHLLNKPTTAADAEFSDAGKEYTLIMRIYLGEDIYSRVTNPPSDHS